jgi:hypothetical protein
MLTDNASSPMTNSSSCCWVLSATRGDEHPRVVLVAGRVDRFAEEACVANCDQHGEEGDSRDDRPFQRIRQPGRRLILDERRVDQARQQPHQQDHPDDSAQRADEDGPLISCHEAFP